MSNAQFVRDAVLPSGWIDLGIGEARLIRQALEDVRELAHRTREI